MTETKRAIEAVLMAAVEPIEPQLLAQLTETPVDAIEALCVELREEYERDGRGFTLVKVAGGYRYQTAADIAPYVERFVLDGQHARLSGPALETLAIIAYKQPVTKSEIEAIRGVDSSGTLATLLERSLVTIRGRSTVVGRPLLYGSTPEFLNYFGLRDLAELPRPEELRALVAAREPEQLDMLELDADGLGAFAALGDVDDDALALVEAHQPRALQGRGVDEHILATAVAHDKAEPLCRVVPLDRALLLRARRQRRLVIATATARPRAAARRTRRRRRRAVDVQHLGHLRAALPRRHPNLQRLAGLDLLHPDPAQHARV